MVAVRQLVGCQRQGAHPAEVGLSQSHPLHIVTGGIEIRMGKCCEIDTARIDQKAEGS